MSVIEQKPAPSKVLQHKTILLVEDDVVLNELVSRQLKGVGYNVRSAKRWREAEAILAQCEPDLIILDMCLPDANGADIIPKLSEDHAVIVLTAFGSIQNAVQAIKTGAYEYLSKPVNFDELEVEVERALKTAELRRDIEFVRDRERAGRKSLMVGESPALLQLMKLIDAVAPSNATVLIQGESGVGKELVAREVHERSPRHDRNFVALDCCTLTENLFESELFGHERGAFTGAIAQKRGLIEAADGGTLFLDEIGEISAVGQAKLLRVIETRKFRRVGGVKDLEADVRIVAATNRDLARLAREGTFRSDLYYRLSAFVVQVPPLRERREDIAILARHFLAKHDFSRRVQKSLSQGAERMLVGYDWPGNVRELRNVMERAIILSGADSMVRSRHLGLPQTVERAATGAVRMSFEHEPSLEDVKRQYVESLHRKYGGHRSKLAVALGVSERNLYRLLKRYGLE
jgi:DNA-binding NtrC family response regulator